MEVIKRKSEVEKLDLKKYAEEVIKEKVFEKLKERGINKNAVESIGISYFKMQVSFNNNNRLVLRFFPSSVSVFLEGDPDFVNIRGEELDVDVLLVLNSGETEQIIRFIKNYVQYQ